MSGSKRKIIQVDEDKLKMMMAGDIPIKADPVNDTVEIKKEEQDKEPDISKGIRRKKSKKLYAEIFLCKPVLEGRRQSTILFDAKNYDNIMKVLKTVDGISMSNFINNVLTSHFEEYEEEIIEIKKNYINNIY